MLVAFFCDDPSSSASHLEICKVMHILNHCSIVVITTIVVAATSSAISSRFGAFSRVGSIIGTSVSAAFLIILGLLNIYICYKLVEQMRELIRSSPDEEQTFNIQGAGCLFYLFKKMFKLIDK